LGSEPFFPPHGECTRRLLKKIKRQGPKDKRIRFDLEKLFFCDKTTRNQSKRPRKVEIGRQAEG
jgi:hypothetical protein